MLEGIVSILDRKDVVPIIKYVAYSLYQKPPLENYKSTLLETLVQIINIDDADFEKIFLIDIRYNLDFDSIMNELSYNSTKGLFFLLETISIVLQDKTLKTSIRENISKSLPFSVEIQQDIIKMASGYVEISSKIYNYLWGIEKTSLFSKATTDIPPYQKLFFIDYEKITQISTEEKKSFFAILLFLMLDDGKIDALEQAILIQLSLLMNVKDDFISSYESYQTIDIHEVEIIKTEWVKRFAVFCFLFSRTENLKDYKSKRLELVLKGFDLPQEKFNVFLSDMYEFKESYDDIIRTIQSSAISSPSKEKNARYAQQGLSVLGAAVAYIPVIGPTLSFAQKVSETGSTFIDRRSGNLMDFGLIDINEDYQNQRLIICIDGFLSEFSDQQFMDWNDSLKKLEINAWIKGFKWPSSALSPLLKSAGSAWYEAVENTAKAGERLANDIEMIYRLRSDIKITLMGHSLGARVILNTLTHLHLKKITLYDAYFLGGAVTRTDKAQWLAALSAVEYKAYNFYSANDDILKKIYQGVMLGDSPAGLGLVECHHSKNLAYAELVNIDSTTLIGGHTEYKDKLDQLIFEKGLGEAFLGGSSG